MTPRSRSWLEMRWKNTELSVTNKAFMTKSDKDELKDRQRWQMSAELCNGKRDILTWLNRWWKIQSTFVTAVPEIL